MNILAINSIVKRNISLERLCLLTGLSNLIDYFLKVWIHWKRFELHARRKGIKKMEAAIPHYDCSDEATVRHVSIPSICSKVSYAES